MRKISSLVLSLSVWCMGIGASEAVLDQIQSNNAFALELYDHLKNKKGNIFVSPYSISSALAMTSIGAKGETRNQINKVFHFNPDVNALASSFSILNSQMSTSKDTPEEFPQVNIANSIWMQVVRPFVPGFVDILEKYFNSGIYALNFEENPEPSRQEINHWVAEQTRGKINDLLPAGSINSQTHLVLTNAIYMQAPWKMRFKKNMTTHEPFYLEQDDMALVEMMNTTSFFRLLVQDQFTLLELPYGLEKGSGTDLSMLVFLPKEIDGLAQLEKQIKLDKINDWVAQMNYCDVQVRLPKFKMEDSISLKDVLSEMGMGQAFTQAADFSGISGSKDIAIDNVFHKAYIKVDEKGTEAAAATGVVVGLTSIGMEIKHPPYYFLADHPFLFVIMNKGSILFIGRFVTPS